MCSRNIFSIFRLKSTVATQCMHSPAWCSSPSNYFDKSFSIHCVLTSDCKRRSNVFPCCRSCLHFYREKNTALLCDDHKQWQENPMNFLLYKFDSHPLFFRFNVFCFVFDVAPHHRLLYFQRCKANAFDIGTRVRLIDMRVPHWLAHSRTRWWLLNCIGMDGGCVYVCTAGAAYTFQVKSQTIKKNQTIMVWWTLRIRFTDCEVTQCTQF